MYQTPYPQYYTNYYNQEDPKKVLRRQLRKDSSRLSFGVVVVTLLMVILFSAFIVALQIYGYPFTGEELTAGLDEEMYFLLNGLYYLLSTLIPFGFILIVSKQDPNEAVPVNKVGVSTFILSIFMGSGLCLATNFPTNTFAALLESFGLNTQLPESHVPQTIYGIVLYYIFVSIIPPFVEEFIFRGIIISRLRKYGNAFAVFASAIMFALFHGNILQFIFAFFCGLVLGFVMIKTNNLFVPIAIHFVNNAFSVTVELLYEYCYESFANILSSFMLLGLLGLGALSLVILLIINRKFFKRDPESKPSELSLASRIWNFIFNPGFAALLIYYIVMSVQFLKM